jgi:hypothetical protein
MTALETGPAPQSVAALPPRTSLYGDDVIFMYPPLEPATYAQYGCTMLAWGGAAKGETARWLAENGIHGTGSLWCLTAGPENLHKNADLRDAVARDIEGKPIPVWWLFDVTYEGTPTWFGCTNHHAFRAHVRQRVAEEMAGNAPGLHVDDHLGTAHPVAFLGGCFCDHCMAEFRTWLMHHGTAENLATACARDWDDFDYRSLVRQYATTDAQYQLEKESIPLYDQFLDCQLQLAAENVRQLGALASEIVKRPITLSANTCLPESPHIVVTPHLTHLVGEVNHHAERGTAELLDAVHAYRMAQTIGKPLAGTAKGQDWAWVKVHGAVNLVKIWIALGYCAGQRLMAPHRQWCYTMEKGTHWYDGPAAEFAPLYRFVRAHTHLFRDTTTLGPLVPPGNVPRRFDTSAQRAALHQALAVGDPRPLQSGSAWVFPRRKADGGLVIHVLNLDYKADTDSIAPQPNLSVHVSTDIAANLPSTATLFSYDAPPTIVPVRHAPGESIILLPELRLWTVISTGPSA